MNQNVKFKKSSSNGIDFATHLAKLNRAVDELDKTWPKSRGKIFGNESGKIWAPPELPPPKPTPSLFPRSATTDLASGSNVSPRGEMSPATTTCSSVTSTETAKSPINHDSVRDLKWTIMKLTAENIELKSTNLQVTNAGTELLAEYQKVVKTAKELRQGLSNAENREGELQQQIMELKSQLARKPPPPPPLPPPPEVAESKPARRSRRPPIDPPSSPPPTLPRGVQKVANREKEQRKRTEVSAMFLDPVGKARDQIQPRSKSVEKKIKTIPEATTVYTTPSNDSVTPPPSVPLSKYTSKVSSPQPSTSRFTPRSKPTFEFQFKNITQSLKRSKKFTNFVPPMEEEVEIRKAGSDATNETSGVAGSPLEYFYSPKAFMNAILGLRNSSSAVLDPEVKETLAERKTQDNQNSNETQTDQAKDNTTD